MNIKIVAVGKLKEDFFKRALVEYEKRLSSYCKIKFIYVGAEPILDDNLYDRYRRIEGERILDTLDKSDYVVVLDIKGKKLSSEDFALKISEVVNQGVQQLCFVIGGANGLDEGVLSVADMRLSFSEMTFTHQMILVILTEQIYRAYKILNNEKYHR